VVAIGASIVGSSAIAGLTANARTRVAPQARFEAPIIVKLPSTRLGFGRSQAFDVGKPVFPRHHFENFWPGADHDWR
jgi:hypothetical protein